MYDIAKLKRVLPYCVKIDIEAYENMFGDKHVLVTCHYAGGLKAEIKCPDMPADTDTMAELVAAGAVQCLAAYAQSGVFTFKKHRRVIQRDDGSGRPSVQGSRINEHPSGAPSVREVVQCMQGVIDVDGIALNSSQFHSKPNQPFKQLSPAPRPKEELDPEKSRRATQALAELLSITGDNQ